MGLSAADKDWVKKENTTLKENITKELLGQVDELKATIVKLTQENTPLRERIIQHDIALDDLEQYGRRMAIRIEGIAWKEEETNVELETTVVKELGKHGVVLEPRDIIRLHRSSKPKEKDGVVTKQTIVKLARWRTREKFAGFNRRVRAAEQATGTAGPRVNNDLTKRRLMLLGEARAQIKSRLLRTFTEEQIKKGLKDNENVFAYANINSDLRIRARGRVLSFNSIPELDAAIAIAFPLPPIFMA